MDAIVEVKNLVKEYSVKGKGLIKAVNKVSFSVGKGEIFGLLGPNGAGKSSVIRMICGLLIPDEGDVWINGFNTKRSRTQSMKQISTVLEGNRNLYWRMTVKENITYFVGNRGLSYQKVEKTAEELLDQFRLSDKKDELVGNLSRGMQQKLAILIAVVLDTKVILLDEPTLGLDVETTDELKRNLVQLCREYDKTIIISTHDMKVVQEICDRVVIVNQGKKVVEDTVSELMELFRTKTYTIKVKGGIMDEKSLQQVQKRYPLLDYDHEKGVYVVTITEGNMLYTLMDALKEAVVPLESIEMLKVDFEKVYTTLCERDIHDVIHA